MKQHGGSFDRGMFRGHHFDVDFEAVKARSTPRTWTGPRCSTSAAVVQTATPFGNECVQHLRMGAGVNLSGRPLGAIDLATVPTAAGVRHTGVQFGISTLLVL